MDQDLEMDVLDHLDEKHIRTFLEKQINSGLVDLSLAYFVEKNSVKPFSSISLETAFVRFVDCATSYSKKIQEKEKCKDIDESVDCSGLWGNVLESFSKWKRMNKQYQDQIYREHTQFILPMEERGRDEKNETEEAKETMEIVETDETEEKGKVDETEEVEEKEEVKETEDMVRCEACCNETPQSLSSCVLCGYFIKEQLFE